MSVSAEHSGWELIGEPRYVQGYIHGFAHPGTIVEIRMRGMLSPNVAEAIEQQLIDHLPGYANSHSVPGNLDACHYGARRFLGWIESLRRSGEAPIDVPGSVFAVAPDAAAMVIPCELLARDIQRELIKAMVAVIDAVIRGENASSQLAELASVHEQLAEICYRSGNDLFFFRAAVKQGLPVRELPGGILQFGIGSASKRMFGSFSGDISVISARLARDKRLTSQLLRQSGVPVAPQRNARTVEEALLHAGALGYPVVVKPADLDAGRGVAAGLESPDEVRAAFLQCRKLTENVVVEKYMPGRDYRIPVVRYKALWALERVRGGVTGNGVDSIAALVEALNGQPERISGHLSKLVVDDEAHRLMRKRGLTLQSILPDGERLPLRNAANLNSGGSPVPAFANAHPDNLAIAEQAARALRLELAGIDLIVPDIARSWRETGGIVCEVNAAPNLERSNPQHIYRQILELTVPEAGRIPVVLIVGAGDPGGLAQEVATMLTGHGLRVGCHTPDGVRINGEVVAQGKVITAIAGNLLALDINVDAMVLCVNDTGPMATGLPVDRYDVLLLAGKNISGSGGLDALLRAILPACTGEVIPLGEGGGVPARPLPDGVRWSEPVGSRDISHVLQAALNL